MTPQEFREAAEAEQCVRLKDRTACFYENEWYLPSVGSDGALEIIDIERGTRLPANAELVEALETKRKGHTVGELRAALAKFDDNMRPVIGVNDESFAEIDPSKLRAVEIAINGAPSNPTDELHGDATRAHGEHDPTEVAVLVHKT